MISVTVTATPEAQAVFGACLIFTGIAVAFLCGLIRP